MRRWITRSSGRLSVMGRLAMAAAGIAFLIPACFPSSRDTPGAAESARELATETEPGDLESLADACASQPDRALCERAAEGYRQALAEMEAFGDRPRQAEILQQLGRLHRKYLEDQRSALRYYGEARALYAELGDRRSESVVLNSLGRVHFQLGEMALAVDSWEQALPIKRDVGDRSGEAATLSNLGLASRYRGRFQAALAYYDRALEVLATTHDAVALGRAFNNRGRFYDSLGQWDRSLSDLRTAQRIGAEVGDPALQAMALTAIGRIEFDAGDAGASLASLQAAAGHRRAAGTERGIAVTARSLGEVYEAMGRWTEARESQLAAQRIFEQQDSPRDLARAHASLGRLALASGQAEEARRRYRRAGEIFRELGDPEGVVASLSGLARAGRSLGEFPTAREQISEALSRVEVLRRSAATPDLRRSFLARHQDDVGFLVDLLMEMHGREPNAGHDVRAFEAHERFRARSLFDQIEAPLRVSSGAAGPPQEMRIEALAREVELLSRQHGVLRESESAPDRLRELEAELDEALRRLWSARGEAALRGEAAREMPPASPTQVLGLGEIRRLLDDQSTLLAYRLGRQRSFLWLVSRSSFESYELPAGDEIAADVVRAHRLLRSSHLREARAATPRALAELSAVLLEPVATRLTGRRLLIVAAGALHYLPFSALPAPNELAYSEPGAEPVPLVAIREVVMLPSASSVAALRRRSAGRTWRGDVAVVAGGSPFAVREAESIRAFGDEAGRSVVVASAPRAFAGPETRAHRILHLAAHGEIDAARPELSRLIFDQPAQPRDGGTRMIYADQIASFDLPVDLVVLSACDTALGPVVPGEGFIGLPQAFFQAGASSVLVSLWKVDDEATAALMERLYADLLGAGQPPSAALRQAQNALRARPGWSAPYYWAGFVILGDWR